MMDDEQSCALDNFASTCADLSKLSDTLPSISIDDNNGDQDFFLKEHYDKIDRLRKENFDLKLKLYLLESNEKFTNESELKFKVINEFEKKNEEIKNLKDLLKSQNKENVELKSSLKRDSKAPTTDLSGENQQLKSKLSEAFYICSNLVSHTERLIQMNKKLANKQVDIDKLNKSIAYFDKATQFLTDNSIELIDLDKNLTSLSIGNKQKISNSKSVSEQVCSPADQLKETQVASNGAPERPNNDRNNNFTTDDDSARARKRVAKTDQISHIDQFMKVVESLRNLIEDFRSNKVTYKVFSTRLDSLFEDLGQRYQLLEQLQLDHRESDSRLRTVEQMLKNTAAFRERIKSDLLKSMTKLDSIIAKTHQQTA